jgi:hypothetical protein
MMTGHAKQSIHVQLLCTTLGSVVGQCTQFLVLPARMGLGPCCHDCMRTQRKAIGVQDSGC